MVGGGAREPSGATSGGACIQPLTPTGYSGAAWSFHGLVRYLAALQGAQLGVQVMRAMPGLWISRYVTLRGSFTSWASAGELNSTIRQISLAPCVLQSYQYSSNTTATTIIFINPLSKGEMIA